MMALVELVALAPVSQVAAFVQLVLLQLAVATLELMVRGALMAGGDGDALALPAAKRALGRLHLVFVDFCGPVVEPAFVGALAPGHQRLLGSAT